MLRQVFGFGIVTYNFACFQRYATFEARTPVISECSRRNYVQRKAIEMRPKYASECQSPVLWHKNASVAALHPDDALCTIVLDWINLQFAISASGSSLFDFTLGPDTLERGMCN